MTFTTEGAAVTETSGATVVKTPALSTLRVSELQQVASQLGISGTSGMKKADLLAAIRERQGGRTRSSRPAPAASNGEQPVLPSAASEQAPRTERAPQRDAEPAQQAAPRQESTPRQDAAVDARAELAKVEGVLAAAEQAGDGNGHAERGGRPTRRGRRASSSAGAPSAERSFAAEGDSRPEAQQEPPASRDERQDRSGDRQQDNRTAERQDNRQQDARSGGERQDNRDRQQDNRQQDGRNDRQGGNAGQGRQGGQQGRNDNRNSSRDFDDDGNGRRRGRQRGRDRKRRGRDEFVPGGDVETVSEDDVLVPVAGILDVLDSYAFVRTSGYLPGPNDVYVTLGMVKRFGLRKGDAITGAIKAPREDQPQQQQQGNRAKFNALVRVDSVNGQAPDGARARVEFNALTPLYPQERLRLENPQNNLTTRIVDLVAPIGKGQRGLLVSPPKAGKTMMLQAIANAITVNNPEVHLMVVLVDERPEEVTDMQRTVRGEVIASTFDRPASDHTMVAELAIERAKRLVELGHDVVVLLDGITRLGRAYNLAAPASGRILSGGVDSAALYPPKKFFGAARNIENGGSLTILATALVETGSKMDEVIFEEFKGTGNMELKLDRQLANRRIYPAVDVNASGTRREDILMSAEELKIMWKLRRVLAALDNQQGIELLQDRLKKTKSNMEFLMQVQKTTPIPGRDDEA